MEDLIIECVVMGVSRNGAGLAWNVLAGILESSWTAGLGEGARLGTALERRLEAGTLLSAGGVRPEGGTL